MIFILKMQARFSKVWGFVAAKMVFLTSAVATLNGLLPAWRDFGPLIKMPMAKAG